MCSEQLLAACCSILTGVCGGDEGISRGGMGYDEGARGMAMGIGMGSCIWGYEA